MAFKQGFAHQGDTLTKNTLLNCFKIDAFISRFYWSIVLLQSMTPTFKTQQNTTHFRQQIGHAIQYYILEINRYLIDGY